MLEPVRLLVRVRPVEPEHVGEPALEQAVPAGHDLGDLRPSLREDELLAPPDLDVAAAAHPLDGLRDGRRRDLHVLGQARADHRLAAARQVVDGGQVVLDRGGGALPRARAPGDPDFRIDTLGMLGLPNLHGRGSAEL